MHLSPSEAGISPSEQAPYLYNMRFGIYSQVIMHSSWTLGEGIQALEANSFLFWTFNAYGLRDVCLLYTFWERLFWKNSEITSAAAEVGAFWPMKQLQVHEGRGRHWQHCQVARIQQTGWKAPFCNLLGISFTHGRANVFCRELHFSSTSLYVQIKTTWQERGPDHGTQGRVHPLLGVIFWRVTFWKQTSSSPKLSATEI